jgi:predicted Ser/Thr protein kinase
MKFCPVCEKEYDDDQTHCRADGAVLMVLPEGEILEAADPLIGTTFHDRYYIEARIGIGGMGAVYRGVDQMLGRPVAIKVLLRDLKHDPEQVKRFFNEARVVAKLRHPNTIQVFDYGQSKDGSNFIAMEFMTGEPLDVHLQKHELTLLRVIEILDQICQSLDEAHAAGIIHRDLKPDNIFIDTVNGNRVVKVIDFGIAKMMSGGENLTKAGMVFGTPAFMAPEQAKGEVLDPRSDLYSLGVILYFLLTGRALFTGDNPMEIAVKHITTPPPSVAEFSRLGVLPPSLVALVSTMLAKDREDRPASARAVRTALLAIRDEVLRGGPASSATVALHSGAPGRATTDESDVAVPRGRGWMGAVAAVAALALAGVGYGVWSSMQGPVEPQIAAQFSDTGLATPPPSEGSATAEAPDAALAATPDPASALQTAMTAVRNASLSATDVASRAVTQIIVTSTPSGATVSRTDTGAELGVTPFSLAALREGDPIPLSFALDGHTPQTHEAARTEAAVAVTLVAVRSGSGRTDARPTRPDAPEPTPEPTPEEPRRRDGLSGGLRRPVTIVE